MPIIGLAQPAQGMRSKFNSRVRRWRGLCAVLCLCLAGEIAAPAQTLTVLTRFTGKNGANPNSLIESPNGNFYGSTSYGGPNSQGEAGTVFEFHQLGFYDALQLCSKPNCATGCNPMRVSYSRRRQLLRYDAHWGLAGTALFSKSLPLCLTTLLLILQPAKLHRRIVSQAGLTLGSDGCCME